MRTRGKRWHTVAAAVGIAGAVTPALLRWVRRTGHRRRTVDLRMTVVVERPIAEVFQFCRDFENFPSILDVLERVEDFEDGRSHWVVRAPGGDRIEWNAVVTKYVPNSVVAWQSVPDSSVHASGLMRFFPLDERTTRVDVSLSYRPLRTPLRDAVPALLHPPNAVRLREALSQAPLELGRG